MTLVKSFVFMAMLNIIVALTLFFSYTNIAQTSKELSLAQAALNRSQQILSIIKHETSVLSDITRKYVMSGDEDYVEYYNTILDINLGFLPRPTNYANLDWNLIISAGQSLIYGSETISLSELLQKEGFTNEEIAYLQKANNALNERIKIDMEVFRDIRLLKLENGLDHLTETTFSRPEDLIHYQTLFAKLFSKNYNEHTTDIFLNINLLGQLSSKRINQELNDLDFQRARDQAFTYAMLAMLAITFIGSFIVIYIRIIRSARGLSDAFNSLASGNMETRIPNLNRKDEFGDIARASQQFKQALINSIDQNWVRSNIQEISTNLQKAEQITEATDQFIRDLLPVLHCPVGAFFYFNSDYDLLQMMSKFGYQKIKGQKSTFELGDGLVGQCAYDRTALTITNIPQDYQYIETGTGKKQIDTLYLFPIIQNEELFGVLELGRFGKLTKLEEDLLNSILPVISIYLQNLARAAKTESLLVRSQNQAEELRASEEELRTQAEEIKRSNEKLMSRSLELAEKTEELQASEEELRVGNEELSEKTHALELQQVELKQAKQDAELYAEEMKRANQYKSQFLANMSHELRTPLNSLLILARILADNRSGGLNEDDIEAATIIHDSGQHLLNLINDILDLSKLEARKTEVTKDYIAFSEIISTIKNNFNHVAEQQNIDFVIETEENLPEFLITDRTKLQQILNNLLSNAFKFTDKGQVTTKIKYANSQELLEANLPATDSFIKISVRDTGIGMTPKQLASIFDAFTQADSSTSRKYGGTGLGLTITRSLSELMGGQVIAKSTYGAGSAFNLFLPIENLENEKPAVRVTAQQQLTSQDIPKTNLPSPKISKNVKLSEQIPFDIPDDRDQIQNADVVILIIEDDLTFATIVANHTRKRGFKAVVAASAQTALQLTTHIHPKGILLDINLPDLNGWELLKKLKGSVKTADIPVHILSSDDDPGDAIEKGAIAFSTKTANMDHLNEILARLIAEKPDLNLAKKHNVLIIEDDHASQIAISKILEGSNIQVLTASTSDEGIHKIQQEKIDCIILDLGLPDIDGFDFLKHCKNSIQGDMPPIVIYSGRELNREELTILREYTDSIVIKGARSSERLLSEVALFLHSVEKSLPVNEKQHVQKTKKRTITEQKTVFDLSGHHILLVDDDMRNVFALSKLLKENGAKVTIAKNGKMSLEKLDEFTGKIGLILMDIMMPEMDGMEAITHIRNNPDHNKIPIIAVTAKAMIGEKEKCLAIGADDYLTKPVDIDILGEMMMKLLKS